MLCFFFGSVRFVSFWLLLLLLFPSFGEVDVFLYSTPSLFVKTVFRFEQVSLASEGEFTKPTGSKRICPNKNKQKYIWNSHTNSHEHTTGMPVVITVAEDTTPSQDRGLKATAKITPPVVCPGLPHSLTGTLVVDDDALEFRLQDIESPLCLRIDYESILIHAVNEASSEPDKQETVERILYCQLADQIIVMSKAREILESINSTATATDATAASVANGSSGENADDDDEDNAAGSEITFVFEDTVDLGELYRTLATKLMEHPDKDQLSPGSDMDEDSEDADIPFEVNYDDIAVDANKRPRLD
ncbi:hypothetical protein GQ42DRAFT_163753 [Ramicandelaber brevisporus]|nr:hypothetical protein GQ42DRAFT_163753 [Ramicandelaber brevisporus]